MDLQKVCYLDSVCFDFGGPKEYIDFQVYFGERKAAKKEFSRIMDLDACGSSKVLAFSCSNYDFDTLQEEMYDKLFPNDRLVAKDETVQYVWEKLVDRLDKGYSDRLKSLGVNKNEVADIWICC